jgi:Tfp pilus assembly protein PilF
VTPVRWAAPIVIALATALVYLPTLRNGFVDFDDQTNLVENPFFRGLDASALRWMFTNLDGHYLPLTWLSFALDHRLWGMNPVGYHLTNALLHVANAVVVYVLGVRLLRLAFRLRPDEASAALYIGAAVSAALFALHPLRVESVAWATERRDVLSGLFFLLALDAYVRLHANASPRIAWAALGWYVLSLLAKPVGMSLAIVLVVLDVYPLRRLPGRIADWRRRDLRPAWIEKVPFVVLGVATAVVEGIAERSADTFYSLAQYGVTGRIGQAFFALAFYVWKTVVPVGLSPLYQLPVGWGFARLDVVVSAVFVLATTIGLVLARRRWPWALASWVAYAALLAPVLGIAQAGPHVAADRYSYLATLGWALVAGGAVLATDVAARARATPPFSFRVATLVAAAAAAALGVATWRQIGVWHDSLTLWRTAVAADPSCYICLNNLGNALVRAGRGSEASPYFEAAMRIQPADADAHANLGTVAMQAGRDVEARREFDVALAIDPTHAVAHTNVARLLLDAGDAEGALPHLEAALRKEPNMAEARTNLGLARMRLGDLVAAERELRRAVVLQPDLAIAHNNLGSLLLRLARAEDAAAEFRRAATLDPDFAEPRYNLGLALAALDRADEAIVAQRDAIRIRPSYASAQRELVNLLVASGRDDEARAQAQAAEAVVPGAGATAALAISYMQSGRARDAITVLQRVLARDPSDADAASLLAWLFATSADDALRDGAAAVTLAERAVAAAGAAPDADRLDTLAAAYAEVQRFGDALATARRAKATAESSGATELAREIDERLVQYERGRPYRSD